MLNCWNQVEEIFWFFICFDFRKGAQSPESSSKFWRLKPFFMQFSMRCSFYCTSYSKDSIVLYKFNFDTKTFIVRLELTVIYGYIEYISLDCQSFTKFWVHPKMHKNYKKHLNLNSTRKKNQTFKFSEFSLFNNYINRKN